MEEKLELIRSISKKLMRIIKKQGRIEEIPVRLDEGIEVTPTESHTIQAIGQNQSINVTVLAAHFGVSKSAASQIVAKLARKGFVDKTRSEGNSKEWRLQLTALGWRAFAAHERCHDRHMSDILDRLGSFSLTQIATAAVLLDVIEDVIDERLSER
jgi:DNA-binding MarR family transcriptional regulator